MLFVTSGDIKRSETKNTFYEEFCSSLTRSPLLILSEVDLGN